MNAQIALSFVTKSMRAAIGKYPTPGLLAGEARTLQDVAAGLAEAGDLEAPTGGDGVGMTGPSLLAAGLRDRLSRLGVGEEAAASFVAKAACHDECVNVAVFLLMPDAMLRANAAANAAAAGDPEGPVGFIGGIDAIKRLFGIDPRDAD